MALGGSDTISSVLAGSTGLTLVGGGTLALTAANTYTTGTTISAGTILIGNATALGSGSVTLNDANTAHPTFAGGVRIATPAAADLPDKRDADGGPW